MKTKFSFSKKPRTSLLLATFTLLLLSAQTTISAVGPTWDSSLSTDWNTNGNWLTVPAGGGYPGTTAGNTATFNNLSSVTSLFLSATPANSIAAITFTASETHAFTITVDPAITLTISGTGIVNNSGITQNFVTAVSGFNVGTIAFTNSATAGSMTSFTNASSAVSGAFGGETLFSGTSTAGTATITNNGGTVAGAPVGGGGGLTQFDGTDASHFSTAGSATITNNGGTVSGAIGGETDFIGTSTAGSATITNNGGTVSGAFASHTEFFDSSTAGSATLIANGGTGEGGSIVFRASSTGGTSTVKVFDGGSLDISLHNAPGVTIGSLEGSGHVLLGANNLTVGGNNLSKTFSGVIQDGGNAGGTGGSLTKTGTGTFTLSGANTYTGATLVNVGTLLVNGSTSSSSAVTVNNSGTTLGGTGTIGGVVTVNSGANLHPGTSPGILNTGSVTLNSGSNLLIDINGAGAGTGYDQLNVTGTVTLNGGNLVLTIGGTLTVGEQFIIINNDLSDAVVGTFAQGTSVSSGGYTFSINYAGGDPNDVELSVVSAPTPEPSTWVAGALVFAALAYTQRRRFTRLLRKA